MIDMRTLRAPLALAAVLALGIGLAGCQPRTATAESQPSERSGTAANAPTTPATSFPVSRVENAVELDELPQYPGATAATFTTPHDRQHQGMTMLQTTDSLPLVVAYYREKLQREPDISEHDDRMFVVRVQGTKWRINIFRAGDRTMIANVPFN